MHDSNKKELKKIKDKYSQKGSQKGSTKKKKKKMKLWKKILLVIGVIFGAMAVAGLVVYIVIAATLPADLNNLSIAEATQILDRNGEILYNIHGEENRVVVPYEEIPDIVRESTIAIEDQNFYNHWGFSIRGITRAAFTGYGGGSTITQQFVKNALLTSERTYSRKIKELGLAVEIERRYSKDEILGFYLNQIPYGSNAYGIKSAAETFYAKDIDDLTLAESAYLAALPQAPTFYSPFGNNRPDLDRRKDKVLDSMVDMGFISRDEGEEAKAEEVEFKLTPQNITAPHFVFYVREQLVQKYGEDFVETGGLRVYTSIDLKKQNIAEKAIEKGAAANVGKYRANNAALVSIDPTNGEILAMVGSKNYFDIENDGNVNITTSLQQPGSSFKPYEYVTAFEKGYTTDTLLYDLVTDFGNNYKPENYDRSTRGPVTMRKALANSLNIPAVKTLYLAGIDQTLDMTERLGITSLTDRDNYGLALALGAGEVTPLEHTAAYGVFANDGVRHPLRPILKVEDASGEVVDDFTKDDEGDRVIDEEAVRMLNNVLSDTKAREFGSLGNNLVVSGKPTAAKTGTTQDFRDAWTVGYTPVLATGVWIGNNDNTEMAAGTAGILAAAPIFKEYMDEALSGAEAKDFEPYDKPKTDKAVLDGKQPGEEKLMVNKHSNKIATGDCPAGLVEEKTFRDAHTILFYVDKDNPRGEKPKNPKADPQYEAWEGPVRGWAGGHGFTSDEPPTESEDCQEYLADKQPTIGIASPSEGSKVTDLPIVVSVEADSFFGISKVEFYFDGTKMATDTTAPYSGSFSPTAPNGFHKITVYASDAIGQKVGASVNIDLQVADSAPNVSMTKPGSPVTLDSSTDFPFTLQASATDDLGVASVSFYYDGNLIGTDTTAGAGSTFSVSWATPPGVGTYDVYAVAKDTANQTTQSSSISVKII